MGFPVAGNWEAEDLKIISKKITCAAICNMGLSVAENLEAEDLKIITKQHLDMRYAIWNPTPCSTKIHSIHNVIR